MSVLTFLTTVLAMWITVGVTSAIVMHYRGHRWVPWLLLGSAFGPFVVPLLPIVTGVDRVRETRQIRLGRAGPGTVNIVAGIDGSRAAASAASSVIGWLGERVGSVTLATVRDFESAQEPLDDRVLQTVADSIALPPGVEPGLTELHGRPAEALAKLAVEREAILVIGEQGAGFAPFGLGSVTRAIRGSARGPFLVVGGVVSRQPTERAPNVGAGR